jgi:cell division protein FtsB
MIMSVRGVFASKAMLLLWITAIALSPLTLAGKAHAASGGNLALNPSGTGFPSVSAQYTLSGETAWQTVDGVFSYVNDPHNRWTDWSIGTSTNWLAIDFGASTTFNQVKLYVYNDNGGVMPPKSYVIQYSTDGTSWTNVTNETNTPAIPVEQLNTANFDTVTARYVRAFLTHGAAAVGLTEIEVYYDVAPVMEQIDQLPASGAVTLADQTAISAARSAYDGLTTTQQSMVTNVSKLTADEAAIALLLYQDVTVQSAMSNLAGDTITLRLAPGTVLDATYGMQANKFQLAVNGTQVAVTNAVYDAVDTSLQTIKLTLASADLQYATAAALSVQSGAFKLNTQTYNKAISSVSVTTAPVYSVISKIDQLPAQADVKLSDQTAISAARTAYDGLTTTQQSMVTNVNKLTADEAAIALLLYQDVTVQSAISNLTGDTVTVLLAPDTVLDATYGMQADKFQLAVNGTQVAVTGAVYDSTDSNLHTIKLTLASAALQNATSAALSVQSGAFKLNTQEYNKAISSVSVTTAVYSVISKIDQLPAQADVKLSDQTTVAAARSAYNNLSAVQQSLVTNVNKLVDAEAAIATLQMTFENVALESAFGNAAGNTVSVRLTSVLDATYGMQASNFLLYVNGTQVAVTNAGYDVTDPGKHTMKLTLASADLQNATSAAIVIQKGALKASDGSFNNAIASFPVIVFHQLNINGDIRIGVDDIAHIVNTPSLQVDINQDGAFGKEDIESILEQLSAKYIAQ